MRTNRFLGFIMSVAALAFAATACDDKKEDLGAPSVEVEKSEISFEKTGGTETVQVTATRDWKATTEQDWISIGPREGEASSKAVTVEIKVMENTGVDREGSVKFDIGFDSKTLTVKQKGTGSVADMTVYKNDFDKEKAVKSDSGWKTYLDSFEGWRNETGTGISSVTYASSGVSARTNDKYNSSSSSSDYQGSGMNYLWFGKEPYFEVKNITLPASTNYTLSFGAERNEYSQSGDIDNTFKHDEFKVYVSKDGSKWVQIEYSFPAGDKNKRWDLASSTFTVPDGTSALYLYFMSTKASVYCFDDLTLSISEKAGTVIDFSKGVDLGTGGDTPDVPGTRMSLAQMLTADRTAGTIVESEEVLVGALTTKGYVVTDGTSSIYVYEESTPTVKVGDKVTFKGTLKDYYGVPEIMDPVTTKVSSGHNVTYPKAKDITSTFDSYTADFAEYITYTAKVVKNGSYTNFMVEGAAKLQGALSGAPSAMYSGIDEGDKVQVTGFFNTINKEKNLLNVIAVEVKILEKGEGGGDNPGGETPAAGEFASNVKWTVVDKESYSEKATVNGVSDVDILKLGTGKKVGSATIVVPAGTKKISFYGLAWKGKTASVVAESDGKAICEAIGLTENPGCSNTSPYTIDNVTTASKKTIDIAAQNGGKPLSADMTITVKSVKGTDCRAVLFGIQAEK